MEERVYNPQRIDINLLRNKCGVYQIRNKKNNKVYIGSSCILSRRLNNHFKRLRKNTHVNKHLQNAWNKYGEHSFTFEIVEFCTQEQQYKIEQYWIDYFRNKHLSYNANPFAAQPPNMKGQPSYIRTAEIRAKMSQVHKQRYKEHPELRIKMSLDRIGKNMGKDHVNSIPVVCLETGVEYGGISEAKRKTGCAGVSGCCSGRIHETNELHFMYKKDYEKLNEQQIEEIIFTNNTSVQVVCLETRKCYKKLVEAQADTGVDRNDIRDCCRGKQKEAKGTHWVYYEDYKKLTEEQIQEILKQKNTSKCWKRCKCMETGEIFPTARAAGRAFGTGGATISEICLGKRKAYKGYHFVYI